MGHAPVPLPRFLRRSLLDCAEEAANAHATSHYHPERDIARGSCRRFHSGRRARRLLPVERETRFVYWPAWRRGLPDVGALARRTRDRRGRLDHGHAPGGGRETLGLVRRGAAAWRDWLA